MMADFSSPFVPELPRFTGGAVGYLGYDTAAWFEPVTLQDGCEPDPALRDEAGFMIFDTVLAFDHVQHRILIIANARITPDDDLEALYQFACTKIDFLERELRRDLSHPHPKPGKSIAVTSNVPRERFLEMVKTAKEYIAAGDIYQVVLSQRFEAEITTDPFTVYRALRHVNPSPYMYFLRMGTVSIVGSSPEMLVRVEGGMAQTHPIAGTRPRGRSEEEDTRLAEELKRNEKERSEHVMLVDLGRNDLGRVSQFGSVRVPQFMGLEKYSHVMHLVSIVEGKLADERDRLDALVACFPAGTVIGCSEGPRDGDHCRAGARPPGHLRGRGRISGFRGQPRFLHHDPHARHRGSARHGSGGRRDRGGFESSRRVSGDAGQGAGADSGAGAGTGGPRASLKPRSLEPT